MKGTNCGRSFLQTVVLSDNLGFWKHEDLSFKVHMELKTVM